MSHPVRVELHAPAIHRLPDEILLDIFIKHKEHSRRVHVLSLVCQRWRWIIHGYSPFWSTFCLDLQSPEVTLRAARRIERAGEGQLSVTVKGKWSSRYRRREGMEKDMETSLIGIAHLLQAHLHQLASLSIEGHPRWIECFFQHFDTFPPQSELPLSLTFRSGDGRLR